MLFWYRTLVRPELVQWDGVNSRDRAERVKAERAWDRNLRRCRASLGKLQRSLPKAAQRFFCRASLHDGLLLACIVGDGVDFVASPTLRAPLPHRAPTAHLVVLTGDDRWIYELTYRNVTRCAVDFCDTEKSPHSRAGRFDSWGYDELSKGANGCLRHEILFSSDATILIEFGSFTFHRRAVTWTPFNPRLERTGARTARHGRAPVGAGPLNHRSLGGRKSRRTRMVEPIRRKIRWSRNGDGCSAASVKSLN